MICISLFIICLLRVMPTSSSIKNKPKTVKDILFHLKEKSIGFGLFTTMNEEHAGLKLVLFILVLVVSFIVTYAWRINEIS